MRLDELLADLEPRGVHGDPRGTEITAVTHDSRAVVPGALFCCVRGRERDGHDFAADAVAGGAVALLCERRLDVDAVQVEVGDVRRLMGPVAAAFHGHPSRAMRVVGVTGTNGKTTVTRLLHGILEAHGWPTTVLGTLTGPRTTPEATDLQATLARVRDEGAAAVAMEVSSHALALHRVEATSFAVAVFTNLSRDHLDFHGDMERYFQAKASLFDPVRAGVGVVNLDDPHGRLLRDAATMDVRGYSLDDVSDLELGLGSSTFTWEGQRVHLPLGGAFNVSNALAAATAARELGVPAATAAEGLAAMVPIPGRFQTVPGPQPFTVIVDYAHTPDALEQLLRSVRQAADGGRVLVVFGCGGDRDRAKRPAMGATASRLADVTFLTSDNPRSEEPEAILADISGGVDAGSDVRTEPDRRAAIALAIDEAGSGDVVVVAGKGHETTQTFRDRTVPFDDRAVVAELLAERAEVGRW